VTREHVQVRTEKINLGIDIFDPKKLCGGIDLKKPNFSRLVDNLT
jgi:hypothetical protein